MLLFLLLTSLPSQAADLVKAHTLLMHGRYEEAAGLFADLVNNDTFVEFLTLPAYERID